MFHSRKFSFFQRAIAFFVASSLVFSQSGLAAVIPGRFSDKPAQESATAKEAVVIPAKGGIHGSPMKAFGEDNQTIPSDLGKIEESVPCPRPSAPCKQILYIQDAHNSLEAQKNISKMIHHVVAERGVKTVYEEGYEGAVPSDEYFGSIKDPKIKEKVSYFLLDKLRIGGAEYAHINRFNSVLWDESSVLSKNFSRQMTQDSRHDFKLIGADDLKLQVENIKQYQKTTEFHEITRHDFEALETEISKLTNQYFSKDFKQWLKQKERFQKGELSLFDYVNRLAVVIPGRFVNKPAQESATAKEAVVIPGRFVNKPAQESATAKEAVVIPAEAGIHGSPIKAFGDDLLSEKDPKTFFQKLEKIEKTFTDSQIHSDLERKIFEYSQTLQLLKRLEKLELSFSEYELAKEALKKFKTDEVAQFIAKTTKKPVVLFKQWEETIQPAIRFYEIAEARNQALAKNLDVFLKSQNDQTAVLIFGGFHKDTIKQILKSKNISYQIISPKITAADPKHEEAYKQLMTLHSYAFEIPMALAKAARAVTAYLQAAIPDLIGRDGVLTEIKDITAVVQKNPELDNAGITLALMQRTKDIQRRKEPAVDSRSEARENEAFFNRFDTEEPPLSMDQAAKETDRNRITELKKKMHKTVVIPKYELEKLVQLLNNIDENKFTRQDATLFWREWAARIDPHDETALYVQLSGLIQAIQKKNEDQPREGFTTFNFLGYTRVLKALLLGLNQNIAKYEIIFIDQFRIRRSEVRTEKQGRGKREEGRENSLLSPLTSNLSPAVDSRSEARTEIDKTQVRQKVYDVIARETWEAVQGDSDPILLDSVDTLSLILGLESTFGLSFRTREYEEFPKTVGEVVDLIVRKLEEKGGREFRSEARTEKQGRGKREEGRENSLLSPLTSNPSPAVDSRSEVRVMLRRAAGEWVMIGDDIAIKVDSVAKSSTNLIVANPTQEKIIRPDSQSKGPIHLYLNNVYHKIIIPRFGTDIVANAMPRSIKKLLNLDERDYISLSIRGPETIRFDRLERYLLNRLDYLKPSDIQWGGDGAEFNQDVYRDRRNVKRTVAIHPQPEGYEVQIEGFPPMTISRKDNLYPKIQAKLSHLASSETNAPVRSEARSGISPETQKDSLWNRPMPIAKTTSLPDWVEKFMEEHDGQVYPTAEDRMRVAIDIARLNIEHDTGGPFGAAIFERKSGRLFAIGVNRVVPQNDPTAHAEMMAYRIATERLSNFTLDGGDFEMATSSQPCGMCLTGVNWAGLKSILTGSRGSDVEAITHFDEGLVPSDWKQQLESRGIQVQTDILRDQAIEVLREYVAKDGEIYNGKLQKADLSKPRFDLFKERSNQKTNQMEYLKQFIGSNFDASKIKQEGNLLDLGAGDGSITKGIAPLFHRVVAVEKSPGLAEELKQALGQSEVVTSPMQDYQPMPDQKFDLILVSHALYYLKSEDRISQINRFLSWLKPGGKLVLIHGAQTDGKSDKRRLVNVLSGATDFEIDNEGIKNYFASRGEAVVSERLDSSVETRNFNEMVEIAKFLTLLPEDRLRQKNNEIESYVKQNLWQPEDSVYRLNNPQDILIFTRSEVRARKSEELRMKKEELNSPQAELFTHHSSLLTSSSSRSEARKVSQRPETNAVGPRPSSVLSPMSQAQAKSKGTLLISADQLVGLSKEGKDELFSRLTLNRSKLRLVVFDYHGQLKNIKDPALDAILKSENTRTTSETSYEAASKKLGIPNTVSVLFLKPGETLRQTNQMLRGVLLKNRVGEIEFARLLAVNGGVLPDVADLNGVFDPKLNLLEDLNPLKYLSIAYSA